MVAILDADYNSFESCVFQGPAASRALFDSVPKAKRLRDALTKKFGSNAWVAFNNIAINGHVADLSHMCEDRDVVVAALKKRLDFRIEGDVAVCVLPWSGRRQRLRKATNGTWYLDCGGETAWVAALFTTQNVAVNAVLSNIDKEGITLKELKRIFDRAEEEHDKTVSAGEKQ